MGHNVVPLSPEPSGSPMRLLARSGDLQAERCYNASCEVVSPQVWFLVYNRHRNYSYGYGHLPIINAYNRLFLWDYTFHTLGYKYL